jgi:TRAP-type mannitol/chloroaromatic compound transport system permease small subunit
MKFLLAGVRQVDWLTDRTGTIAKYAIGTSCLISAGNALMRYFFSISSNGWLEIQWYLFAACVMLGAPQVLRLNEHVRVDIFYGRLGGRGQAWVDLLGLLFLLLPSMGLMLWLPWPLFMKMYLSGEMSANAGGLLRWPVMLMLPLGFALMVLQGVAEAVKRVAWLLHRYEGEFHYERPLQ